MPQLGPLEILVIFVVALLVFGPSKLPEIGRQVGRGVAEFRKFQQTLRRDFDGMLGHDDHDEHDDQSAAARPAPMLPPKEPAPQDWTEPPDQPRLGDAFGPEPTAAGAMNPAGANDADGEPMLPLPWPDPLPPPPPPPDDSAPVDRT